jgi:hypothetical protein
LKPATERGGSARLGLAVIALFLALAMLLLAAARPLAAQPSGRDPRLTRLPDQARLPVEAVVDQARAAGLPTEPLVDRALEGAAKAAPPAAIVTAVSRLRDELVTVRGVWGEGVSAAELSAGASAIRVGATAQDLARLRRLRPGQPLTVAAAVLADLVSAGVPADTAVAAVLALAGDAADADYLAFRRNVQRDIALGASPAAALGVRLRGDDVTVTEPPNEGTGQTPGRRPRKP